MFEKLYLKVGVHFSRWMPTKLDPQINLETLNLGQTMTYAEDFKYYAWLPWSFHLALKRVHFWEALDSGADLIFKEESQRLRCG